MVSIDKTDEHFRLLYNTKGRFAVHRIKAQEAEVRPEPPIKHCGSCQAWARRRQLGCGWAANGSALPLVLVGSLGPGASSAFFYASFLVDAVMSDARARTL